MPEFNILVEITVVNEFEGVEADSEDAAQQLVEEALWAEGTQVQISTALLVTEVESSYDASGWEVQGMLVHEVNEQDA